MRVSELIIRLITYLVFCGPGFPNSFLTWILKFPKSFAPGKQRKVGETCDGLVGNGLFHLDPDAAVNPHES